MVEQKRHHCRNNSYSYNYTLYLLTGQTVHLEVTISLFSRFDNDLGGPTIGVLKTKADTIIVYLTLTYNHPPSTSMRTITHLHKNSLTKLQI